MDTLYFFTLVLTVLVLAYKRVRLLPAMTIMIALTVLWTELRHLFYVPSWFRYGNGIVAVTLIGFAVGPLRRLLASIADRLIETRAQERLCYARLGDYARERLGLSARQLQELGRVHKALVELPEFIFHTLVVFRLAEAAGLPDEAE